MDKIILKRGEAKSIKFVVSVKGSVIDCATTTCKFYVANKDESAYLIQKEDIDFDKTYAGIGVLIINISAIESDIDPVEYKSELMITFAVDNIDKSATIDFEIEKAIIN